MFYFYLKNTKWLQQILNDIDLFTIEDYFFVLNKFLILKVNKQLKHDYNAA